MPVRAYVGIGSNQQNPLLQIRNALAALGRIRQTEFVSRSRLYMSSAMGPVDQPDFINAAASLDTRLDAHTLLSELQSIERRQGRVRGSVRWGPRPLDLDLLLYGDEQIATDKLTVPHPGLLTRSFVLHPLHDIAPDLRLGGRTLPELVECLPADDLQLLENEVSPGR